VNTTTVVEHVLRPSSETRAANGPPGWLLVATASLGVLVLVMAVAETNLWVHYLIDGGEPVSLIGVGFIAIAAFFLHRDGRLATSLPLIGPWLLFPVLTQGDQIIDHLSIGPMRVITHVLLGAIFAAPVGVVVLAVRSAEMRRRLSVSSPFVSVVPGLRLLAEGRTREGSARLAALLLAGEIWIAVVYLGLLMVGTLAFMVLAVLVWGSMRPSPVSGRGAVSGRSERSALIAVLVGVALSLGLYFGYKNRPGAYQGSPSFVMDPAQKGSGYRLDRIAVPSGAAVVSASPEALRTALTGYGRTLRRLVDGYYTLDRNYTWDFHNALFVRQTPLLPNYRVAGLQKIGEAHVIRLQADQDAAVARAGVASNTPLAALLDETQAYVAFNFDRAARLESMSAEFEKTPAGLQHAAHIYEGEGKVLTMVLSDILTKHRQAIDLPGQDAVVGEFTTQARELIAAYANRIVGF
jgi:hypothetical protein